MRPSCFAVFKFTTNSNFIGCSTGMSAGFLPFRILSTIEATRRSDDGVSPVRHQPTNLNATSIIVHCRQAIFGGEFDDAWLVRHQRGGLNLHESLGTLLFRRVKHAFQFIHPPHLENLKLQAQRLRRDLRFLNTRAKCSDRGISRATRESLGITSLSSSKRFPLNSGERVAMPVIFPPGCARLATKPNAIGSATPRITMGMVAVAFLAAVTSPAVSATITSTFSRTNSAASSGRRSDLPSVVPKFNQNILTLDIAEFTQPLQKWFVRS